MSEKRPPMPVRDKGGSASLNNPDDGTPISYSLVVGDGLLLVTEKCTYRLQMADQIDPERKNPDLAPTAQQKIFDHGMKSDLMRGTLLHAKVMFKEGFQEIDIPRALLHSFDALSNLIAIRDAEVAFKAKVDAAAEKVGAGTRSGGSLVLPAAGGVREDCKTFIQRADHFSHDLLEIVRLFYPETKGWPDFLELSERLYGTEDHLTKLLAQVVPILVLLRDARNCLDHHLKGVTIQDFAVLPDGGIHLPSIEIDFKTSKHPRICAATFMHEITEWLLVGFEQITVHICAKKLKPFAGMEFSIAEVQPPFKEKWPCHYAYGLFSKDGQFSPCG